ncbi:MAG: DUF116 domain-containing protein [Desulfovibrionaceae bacterium]
MFEKSPHSLPRYEYGGARKRVFIGLMVGSCGLIMALLLAVWIVPYLGLSVIHPSLPFLSGVFFSLCLLAILWICATLVYHIYTGRSMPGIKRVRALTIRLILPLMELLGRFVGIKRSDVRLSFVKVNNEMVLASGIRVRPQKLLLLLPHCIQRAVCPHRLTTCLERCSRCGLCPMGALLDLRDRYGFVMAVASGGTIARRIVVEARPQLIIAVACERDLTSGIQDSYPLPVFGVLNTRPKGPCVDTLVDVVKLDEVVKFFLAEVPTLGITG